MARFEDDYELQDHLGGGVFGDVYRALNRADGRLYAVKISKESSERDGIPASILRETTILKRLNAQGHENILRFIKAYYGENRRATLVFELMDGDLAGYLRSHETDELMRRHLMRGIMKGVQFLHQNSIIHRDLKPPNILMKGTTPVIADFGLSRSMSIPAPQLTANVVAAIYRAPELHLGSTNYNASIDVWSCGVIMAEIYGPMLFRARTAEEVLGDIYRKLGTPTPAIWPDIVNLPEYQTTLHFPAYEAVPFEILVPAVARVPDALDLFRMMLIYDPAQRITADQSLEHPYLQGV